MNRAGASGVLEPHCPGGESPLDTLFPTSVWSDQVGSLKSAMGESVYTIEIGRCYESGPFFLESQFLDIS